MPTKQQILICDDQHIIHETLGVYLKNEGFDYISAFDGEQAIEDKLRLKKGAEMIKGASNKITGRGEDKKEQKK